MDLFSERLQSTVLQIFMWGNAISQLKNGHHPIRKLAMCDWTASSVITSGKKTLTPWKAPCETVIDSYCWCQPWCDLLWSTGLKALTNYSRCNWKASLSTSGKWREMDAKATSEGGREAERNSALFWFESHRLLYNLIHFEVSVCFRNYLGSLFPRHIPPWKPPKKGCRCQNSRNSCNERKKKLCIFNEIAKLSSSSVQSRVHAFIHTRITHALQRGRKIGRAYIFWVYCCKFHISLSTLYPSRRLHVYHATCLNSHSATFLESLFKALVLWTNSLSQIFFCLIRFQISAEISFLQAIIPTIFLNTWVNFHACVGGGRVSDTVIDYNIY